MCQEIITKHYEVLMEILVFSDSHGSTSKFIKAFQRHPKIEYVIHLGDNGTDISLINEIHPTYITEAVQGNCDRQRLFPTEKVLQLIGKRIFITHGHHYGVKNSLVSLVARGLQEKADMILFGHTHEPTIEMKEGIWLVNPGSIGKPKYPNKASYAILELGEESINARILEV
jgi:uncharacterized protein